MNLDILILGCIKQNIMKQTDVGICCMQDKKLEYVCSTLRKLDGTFFILIKCIFIY